MAGIACRIYAYARLMRVDRPIGTYLLLWPTLWAIWLASHGQPPAETLLIFVLGVIVMRAFGSLVNDLVDRNIDPRVARTQGRPLATQEIFVFEAVLWAGVLLVLAFLLWLNLRNVYTQFIAVLGVILAVLYPYAKRYTPLPQGVLGVVWSLSILMAFTEIQGRLPWVAFLMYLSHICLTMAYDTMYAICDREDDKQIGVKSMAILLSEYDRLGIAALQGLAIGGLCAVGYWENLHGLFYLFLAMAGLSMLYQQWLIRNYVAEHCLAAFKNNQLTGLLIFLGMVFGVLK